MNKRLAVTYLLLIFLVTFLSRAFVSFQTDEFAYDAYFSLRQVESIKNSGLPLFNDPLSFGGRVHLFHPLFYYFISIFASIGSGLASKIIPNLLASTIIFAIYLLSFHITKNRSVSLLSSFMSGFIPVFFINFNDISSNALMIPLTFFLLYSILKIDQPKHLGFALLFLVLLVLTSASVFMVILGLLLFLLLTRVESLEVNRKQQEFILFASFLALWFNFIIFKKAFIMHGPFVIWQNIPVQILSRFFFDLNLLQVTYYVGFIPLVLGVYSIYHVLFKQKKRSLFLFIALFLSVLLLLWLKLIQFELGLVFLSFALVLLSSHTIKQIHSYFKKTKVSNYANLVLVGLFVLFVLTSVIPSFTIAFSSINNVPSDSEVKALEWLKENSDMDAVVLARPQEGYIINYFAERKTVIDYNFLLVNNVQQIYEDVQSIFSLRLKTESLRRLNKYDVDYIYFSGRFGVDKKLYYIDEECFPLVYDDEIKIYSVECSLQ